MYLIGFIITFLFEIIIALYFTDGIIRNYIGDILIIICLYFFSKIIFLDKIKNIELYILMLGIIAETMQYFNISKYLANDNKILKIILGTTFDIKDIVCYLIGCAIIVGTKKVIHKSKNNN